METELSCSQTDIELWVLPFLSYELWKLRIELRKHLTQTGSKKHVSCLCKTVIYNWKTVNQHGKEACVMFLPTSRFYVLLSIELVEN